MATENNPPTAQQNYIRNWDGAGHLLIAESQVLSTASHSRDEISPFNAPLEIVDGIPDSYEISVSRYDNSNLILPAVRPAMIRRARGILFEAFVRKMPPRDGQITPPIFDARNKCGELLYNWGHQVMPLHTGHRLHFARDQYLVPVYHRLFADSGDDAHWEIRMWQPPRTGLPANARFRISLA